MRLERGDNRGATEAFQACTQKRPDWPEAQMNLAIACWNIGDHDGAGKAFEAVLAATPESVDALKGLAALAVEREKFDQALDYQGRLIEKGERTPELFYNTGLLLQKSGQLEDAARLYREALEERPGFAEALLNLGHVLKSQGRQEEARDCWKQALDQKPELAQGYFGKAN
jgi:tetratricopeptide (TPR) repeat protein